MGTEKSGDPIRFKTDWKLFDDPLPRLKEAVRKAEQGDWWTGGFQAAIAAMDGAVDTDPRLRRDLIVDYLARRGESG